jgi:hypothetical protein
MKNGFGWLILDGGKGGGRGGEGEGTQGARGERERGGEEQEIPHLFPYSKLAVARCGFHKARVYANLAEFQPARHDVHYNCMFPAMESNQMSPALQSNILWKETQADSRQPWHDSRTFH